MRTVVTQGKEQSRIRDKDEPTPGENEVLVRVKRVQLSVTECNLYKGRQVAHYDDVYDRINDGGAELFGHEFCGVVVDKGETVANFDAGDRVYAPDKVVCGTCNYCTSGYSHHCANKQGIGYELPGALSEYALFPKQPLCKVPEGVSDAEGAAMQPLASSLLCALEADISPGDTVAIIGMGVMGYQTGQIARSMGVDRVFGIDIRQKPLQLARERGMVSINDNEKDVKEVIMNATGGVGANVVFEAVGGDQNVGTHGSEPLALAHDIVRRGGKIVQVGHIEGELTLTPRVTRSKSVDWVNPTTGVCTVSPDTNTGELAAKMVLNDRVTISEYITHELEGLDSFERAVDITLNKQEHDALGPAQIIVE